MDWIYAFASLLAWNPWLAYGLTLSAIALRLLKFQAPAYFVLICVGGAVGLSHGATVTPPPDCEPLARGLFAAVVIAASLAVGGWNAIKSNNPRRWLCLSLETIASPAVFLAPAYIPILTAWLAALGELYLLVTWSLRTVQWIRQRRNPTPPPRPSPDSSGPACAPCIHGQRTIGLALLALALILASLYAPRATAPTGGSSYTGRMNDWRESVADRANHLYFYAPKPLQPESFQLKMEAQWLQERKPDNSFWLPLWRNVAMLEFGLDPGPTRRGQFPQVYRSPIDGSAQPYMLWVPPAYDPATPLPLMVWLHGHGNFTRWQGLPLPDDLHPANVIVISPHARGSLDYTGIQANEVWQAIDEVCRSYTIDQTRIYCAGHSMGGTGSWYLASQRPGFFAAIAPSSPNLSPWGWGYKSPTGDPKNDALTVSLQQNEATIGWVDNLLETPILASHGQDDPVVPVENSRLVMAAIAQRRQALHMGPANNQWYFEKPGVGHAAFISPEERLRWMLTFRRPQPNAPNTIPPATPPVPAYGPIYRAFDEPFVLVVPDDSPTLQAGEPAIDRDLALQLIHRERIAFAETWNKRYGASPPIQTAAEFLHGEPLQGLPQVPRHPIILGGPSVNAAAASLIAGAGQPSPMSTMGKYQIPAGFDLTETHLMAAGVHPAQATLLYAILPPRPLKELETATASPFAVIIVGSEGCTYFQCLRRFGVLFTSYALRSRIWFDYALADRQSFDSPSLLYRCGFYTPQGEVDPARSYTGNPQRRMAESGGAWPLCMPANPALFDLCHALPLEVELDAPLTFGAHPRGGMLYLQSENLVAEPILQGLSLGSGHVTWHLPPGRWRLKGRVGPDYTTAPPPPFVNRRLGQPTPTVPPAPPTLGFKVLVDEKQQWASFDAKLIAKVNQGKIAMPAAWRRLQYDLDLPLPEGNELRFEVQGLNGPPWVLPPSVWADVRLEPVP